MKEFTGFKFCPQCGSREIDVFMKNAVRCGSCGYSYFHNVAAAVAAIVEIDNKVLLLRRAHEPRAGLLDLPGGFVDYRETLEEALMREVKEECRLDITDICYFGSFANTYRYLEVTYFTADALFICKPVDVLRLGLSDETTGYVTVAPDEIDLGEIAFDSIRKALGEFRKNSS